MSELVLISPAFKHMGVIPLKYTHTGFSPESLNYSPPLKWDHMPKHTKSFALICKDPDAVGGVFTHWVLYNIPKEYRELPENLPKSAEVVINNYANNHEARELCQGLNDYQSHGYYGPNPPITTGVHRYIFTLYALDLAFGHNDACDVSMTSVKLEEIITKFVLARAELIGLAGV